MGEDINTIASIQHLFKTVPIQVAQHLKAHCTIMWMKACSDLSWDDQDKYESTNTNRKSNLVLCSCTEIKQSVSRSEAKCRHSNKLNRYPYFNKGNNGNNYLPIKEDETNGDRKKHLTYLDGKQSRIVAFLKWLHWFILTDILLKQNSLKI